MRTCWARLGLSLKKANPIRTSHFSWRMRGYASSDDDMSGHDDDDSDFDDDARDEEASFGNESARSLKVVRKDVQLMNVVRGIVILAILTMTVIAADCVFVVTTEHEARNFKQAYKDVSAQLHRKFYDQVENFLWVAKGFSVGIGQSMNMAPWPNATVSNFAAISEAPLHLSNASLLTFSPILSSSSRLPWEAYASATYKSLHDTPQGSIDSDHVTYHDSKRHSSEGIYNFNNGTTSDEESVGPYLFPIWQAFPLLPEDSTSDLIGTLFNEGSHPVREKGLKHMMDRTGSTVTSFLYEDSNLRDLANYDVPRTNLYYPVFHPLTAIPSTAVASIGLQFQWETTLRDAVIDYIETLVVVVENSFEEKYSYAVNGFSAKFLGYGDLHNPKVDGFHVTKSTFDEFSALFDEHGAVKHDPNNLCSYKITVYPSKEFKEKFLTNRPDIFRGIVLLSLFVVVGIFIAFDAYVARHQQKVLDAAKQSDAIVRSLFPEAITDRLYEEARKKENEKTNEWKHETQKSRVKKFMRFPDSVSQGSYESDEGHTLMADPIADLFPNTTVLFADLAGFTAWSSEREPAQVFVLLETIYRAMDKTAKRMHVFKVETIGDCYVAATGLPEPQEDHAQIMARFARKCLRTVSMLTKRLESRLGPGTADLAMRVGIHSGPVTAGVLRGQKARFQLFGDTMNMASRIESSGEKNRIHLSKETARLLPESMVTIREDVVTLKGKGPQETYWLAVGASSANSHGSSLSDGSATISDNDQEYEEYEGTCLAGIVGQTKISKSIESLIDWNVDVLKPLLSAILAQRVARGNQLKNWEEASEVDFEVQVVIPFPPYNDDLAQKISKMAPTCIAGVVEKELRGYISAIATCYPKNAFHSFEHCSHVVLSATKLLKRILASDDADQKCASGITLKEVHDHTFGISSDPITQFAVVFSALVHDVGHSGVANQRLAIEEPQIAEKYKNQSIAERRSLDIAFQILQQSRFQNLRKSIYGDEQECVRFRHVVVNSVLATDIFDKQLSAIRNARWERAFNKTGNVEKLDDDDDTSIKATIVLEQIILASDVAHTMQHFCIYQKWNERLFLEMNQAYRAGRSDKDPSEGWYNGELWFFDNYIIPLANKLKECGVFGVNSEEYLHYACQNRQEWALKGHTVVGEMTHRASKKERRRKSMQTVDEGNEDSFTSERMPIAEPDCRPTGTVEDLPCESDKMAILEPDSTLVVADVPAKCRTVVAPPGKLLIVLNTSERGLIRVDHIEPLSPLVGLLQVGEYIVSIDDEPTINMPVFDVGVLLNKNRDRRLQVVTDEEVARTFVDCLIEI